MKHLIKSIALIILLMPCIQSFSSSLYHEGTIKSNRNGTKTIIFIHGLFVNSETWDEWKVFFEERGYRVLTPDYPGHKGNPSGLRDTIDPSLKSIGFVNVLDELVKIVEALPEKPIVVGHSMGGLIVQKLVEMDLVVAGVSIDGAPPKNVKPPFSTLKAVWPAINFFKSSKHAFIGSKDWYHERFFNTYSKSESDFLFEKFAVPESRKLARESASSSFAKIDLRKPHQPLLFIGGEKDAIFSEAFTKKVAGKYKDHMAILDYKAFENRSHFIVGQEGWKEVALFVHNWLENLD